ncbi:MULTISPECIES: DUF1097 domain-containing protein [Klebsiella]|uniref:DUF1097 domain-containing protein n=1 Tax=Klebsiella TaxID=570 RepID=UPI0013FD511F|nr:MULTISPECIES: DUF1097 domain-containing protein [Klebsiella]MCE5369798.1 DUF1097 domain-containing protein [Klebsiella oxytoca]
MKIDLSIAITTALFSAIWVILATTLNIPAWAGFLGCTTYFAINQHSRKAFLICALSLISGSFWACMSLELTQFCSGSLFVLFIATGLIAFFMCIQARLIILSFIPAAFIGSCTVFAGANQLTSSLEALFIGLLTGYLMKSSGYKLHELTESEKQKP